MVLKRSRTIKNSGNTTRSGVSSKPLKKFLPHHNQFLKLMRQVLSVADADDAEEDNDEFPPRLVIPAHCTEREMGRSSGVQRWLNSLFHPDVQCTTQQKQRWHLLDFIQKVLNKKELIKEPLKAKRRSLAVMAKYGAWDHSHSLYLQHMRTADPNVKDTGLMMGAAMFTQSYCGHCSLASKDSLSLFMLWCRLWEEDEERTVAARTPPTKRARPRFHNQHYRGQQRRLARQCPQPTLEDERRTRDSGECRHHDGPVPKRPKPITSVNNRHPHKFWAFRRLQRRYKFRRNWKAQNKCHLAEQLTTARYTVSGRKHFREDLYDEALEDMDTGANLDDDQEEEFKVPERRVLSLLDFMRTPEKSRWHRHAPKPYAIYSYTSQPLPKARDISIASKQTDVFLTQAAADDVDFDAVFSDVDGAYCRCILPTRDIHVPSLREKFGGAVDFAMCLPFTAVFNLRGAAQTNDVNSQTRPSDMNASWLLVCQAAHHVWPVKPPQRDDGCRKISVKLHGNSDGDAVEAANTQLKQTLSTLGEENAGSVVFPSLDALLMFVLHTVNQLPSDGKQWAAGDQIQTVSTQVHLEKAMTSRTALIDDSRCSNCFTLYDGVERSKISVPLFISMTACGHSFCRRCWQRHLVYGIVSGKRTLLCMGYKCGTVVDASTVLSLVPHWALTRWQEQFRLNMAPPRKELLVEPLDVQVSPAVWPLAPREPAANQQPVPPVREQTAKGPGRDEAGTKEYKQASRVLTKNGTQKAQSRQLHPPYNEGKEKDTKVKGLLVTGEEKRTSKPTVVAARRVKPKEPEVLSKVSLTQLARGLGKNGNGLTLPMLLNMPTTTIIKAIYSDNNDRSAEEPVGKGRGGWMLERCLFVWQEQTSGLKDEVRMRSLERALLEMGEGELAARVMECYRNRKRITPDLFKSRAVQEKEVTGKGT